MKNEKNVIDESWSIWAPCLCTRNSFGCVLSLVNSSREITRELTILEGQPPSISDQSNFIGNQFAIIFIFKPKLRNPKIIKCLDFKRFLPLAVF